MKVNKQLVMICNDQECLIAVIDRPQVLLLVGPQNIVLDLRLQELVLPKTNLCRPSEISTWQTVNSIEPKTSKDNININISNTM